MHIVLLGARLDPVLQRLEARLAAEAELSFLDPVELQGQVAMTWDEEGFLWGRTDVSAVDAIVVRRLPALHVAPPADRPITAAEVIQDNSEALERSQLVDAWLWDCEQRGVAVLNSCASRPFDAKPRQLLQLQRAGIQLPRTLITGLPVAAEAFANDVGECIFKPVAGGRETAVLDAAARERLQYLSSPVIFQQRIIGPDLRVTVVNDVPVSQVEIPSHPVDYRLGEAYRAGAQEYKVVELPAEVLTVARKVASLCSHELSGIDFKRDEKTGAYFVLEANSAPAYLDIELKTGHPITEHFAKRILERAAAVSKAR